MEIHISNWTHKFQNKTGLDAKANSELYKSNRVCSVGVFNEDVFILDWRSESKGIEIAANKQIFFWGGGGGCHIKGKEGGFSGPNGKLDTDGQPYLTIPYTRQGFQNRFRTGCDE
jgi:hypothetical protein